MYIAPNSTIKLMNTQLDPNYDNTIYFSSLTAQTNYFNSVNGVTFTEQYYTRPYRGYIRVEISTDNAYTYNYMRFKNTSYGNKWFYAFLTKPKWINNQVTEFEFKIDVIQTWYFDYQLEKCFVDREHAASDEIGENLLPENLETGEYIIERQYTKDDLFTGAGAYVIVVLSTLDKNGNRQLYGHPFGGIYCGMNYLVFKDEGSTTAVSQVNDYIINTITASPDAIQGIYMVPEFFTTFNEDYSPHSVEWSFSKQLSWTYSYHGKTGPRNNKLYTSPFNTLVMSNQDGTSREMPYEYFQNVSPLNMCTFEITGIAAPRPECMLVPVGYKTKYASELNLNEKIVLDNFPQCAYATDTFRAWMAQNKYGLQIESLSGATNAVFGVARNLGLDASVEDLVSLNIGYTPNNAHNMQNTSLLGATKSLTDYAFQAARIVNSMYQHSLIPPTVNGGGSNALGIATETLGFRASCLRIRDEFAAIIDDYFDKYGYATHLVKVPNTHVRKRWTFTKTVGCNIKQAINSNGLPADDMEMIQKIYDKGITFWVTPADIGDYSLDNPPLSSL